VLLAKQRSSVEVVNDINGDLVTFYRCVRFHDHHAPAALRGVALCRQRGLKVYRPLAKLVVRPLRLGSRRLPTQEPSLDGQWRLIVTMQT